MTKNPTVKERVFKAQQYDGDWPFAYDAKLKDVIDWFMVKLLEIPKEYRDIAECEIASESGYEDSHYASIKITYDRPETASERGERMAKEERDAIARRERDLANARDVLAYYGEKP